MTEFNPLDTLTKHFTLKIADNDELKMQEYHFRYHIFCKEFHFESEAHCHNQLEKDIYDEGSTHLQIYQNSTSALVGSIRLVQADELILPFEKYAEENFLPAQDPAIQIYAEASRLAVHPDYRRRRYDGQHVSGINTDETFAKYYPARYFPLVAISMMLGSVALANILKIDRLYAMMEPKLNHVLAGYGIYFDQIGHVANYHGERAPFGMDPKQIDQTVRPDLAELLQYLYGNLGNALVEEQRA
jgi:N-acyl amino acid synthase of PEP-CTERM/exosortase system